MSKILDGYKEPSEFVKQIAEILTKPGEDSFSTFNNKFDPSYELTIISKKLPKFPNYAQKITEERNQIMREKRKENPKLSCVKRVIEKEEEKEPAPPVYQIMEEENESEGWIEKKERPEINIPIEHEHNPEGKLEGNFGRIKRSIKRDPETKKIIETIQQELTFTPISEEEDGEDIECMGCFGNDKSPVKATVMAKCNTANHKVQLCDECKKEKCPICVSIENNNLALLEKSMRQLTKIFIRSSHRSSEEITQFLKENHSHDHSQSQSNPIEIKDIGKHDILLESEMLERRLDLEFGLENEGWLGPTPKHGKIEEKFDNTITKAELFEIMKDEVAKYEKSYPVLEKQNLDEKTVEELKEELLSTIDEIAEETTDYYKMLSKLGYYVNVLKKNNLSAKELSQLFVDKMNTHLQERDKKILNYILKEENDGKTES